MPCLTEEPLAADQEEQHMPGLKWTSAIQRLPGKIQAVVISGSPFSEDNFQTIPIATSFFIDLSLTTGRC